MVYRICGYYLAKLLKHTFITPNQITLSRILLIVTASWIIIYENQFMQIVAAILIILFSMFDALDGSLAVEKNQRTVLGAWLDPQVDRLGFLILFLPVAYR